MSVAAINWCLDLDVYPSTAKFVLAVLCDNAGDDGVVWPSLERICKRTSQDRKTVIAGLDRLIDLRLIAETGETIGNGVKKYQILGLPSGSTHYTYRVTHRETQEFYIGVRSCSGRPEADEYFGSGRWLQEVTPDLLEKQVLSVYRTRQEAEAAELYLLASHRNDPLIRNKFFPKGLKPQPVPNAEPVPRTEPVPILDGTSTKNGTGTSTKNGTQNRQLIRNGTVTTAAAARRPRIPPEEERIPMDCAGFAAWAKKSPQSHVHVLGEWAELTKPALTTKAQWRVWMKRHLRAARDISVFSDAQVSAAFKRLEQSVVGKPRGFITQYTLETVLKFITGKDVA